MGILGGIIIMLVIGYLLEGYYNFSEEEKKNI
jgi:hypothetical protein